MTSPRLFPLFLVLTSVAAGESWADLVREGVEVAKTGNLAGAREAFRRALASDDAKTVAPEALATVWSDVGVLSHELGAWSEALAAYAQASSVIEKAFGPDDWHHIPILLNVATLHLDVGRFAKADQVGMRATAILNAQPTRDIHLVIRSQIIRAGVLLGRGDYKTADQVLQGVLDMAGHSAEFASEASAVLNNLAVGCFTHRDLPRARMYVDRSMALLESIGLGNGPQFIRPLLNSALIATTQGRHGDAVEALTRALAIADAQPGMSATIRAQVLDSYAAALRKAGRKDEARVASARAKAAGVSPVGQTIDIYTLSARPKQ